jgi:pilus assembly protein Flp/PilA
MRQTKALAVRLWKDERGASLLEYSLLVGLIIAVGATVVASVGTWSSGQWGLLKTALGIE